MKIYMYFRFLSTGRVEFITIIYTDDIDVAAQIGETLSEELSTEIKMVENHEGVKTAFYYRPD